MYWYQIALIVIAVTSVITFLTYCIDKKKAVKGKWRTKESVLLGMSLFGGALGGYPAMFIAHHKTKKVYFHIVNIIGLMVDIALVCGLAYAEGLI